MLDFEHQYSEWRNNRISHWPKQANFITIQNASQPSPQELDKLRRHCLDANFALYATDPSNTNKESIRELVNYLQMSDLDQNLCADHDAITTLKTMELGRARGYIPYTNKALNWHTDGYYNAKNEHIRSFLLHCAQCAAQGGESILINHELIYIHLYDQNPEYIKALMQADAMTIPANIENGVEIRPPQSGPVFYRDLQTNQLQMRYTARTRSIEWSDNPLIQEALTCIDKFLQADNDSVLRITLQPGQGLICNNILHGRSAFEDTPSTNGQWPSNKRVLYRARSYNRLFTVC